MVRHSSRDNHDVCISLFDHYTPLSEYLLPWMEAKFNW